MAAIDYGVIVLRDGSLLTENKNLSQGASGVFKHNGLRFEYTRVADRAWYSLADNTSKFYINFDNFIYYDKKRVLSWSYNNVNYHTKFVGSESIYLTTFKFNRHFYHILQGYDVSLDSCYSRKSIKVINKFLGKNNYRHLALTKWY